MVLVFHLALVHVRRRADIVMRPDDQTRSFPREKFLRRRRSRPGGFLLGHHVIEAEDHQRVSIGEDAFVERETLSGLIDALVNGNRLPRGFPDRVLKPHERQVEQFQRSRDALQEHSLRIFWIFIESAIRHAGLPSSSRTGCPIPSHRGCLPGIVPRPVDAETPLALRVFSGQVQLIVVRPVLLITVGAAAPPLA